MILIELKTIKILMMFANVLNTTMMTTTMMVMMMMMMMMLTMVKWNYEPIGSLETVNVASTHWEGSLF